MPIRTGLDSRIEEVRAELREYFAEAKTATQKRSKRSPN